MRLICFLLVLIPVIAASTKFYSVKARVYCGTRPYTGQAEMWVQRKTETWSFNIHVNKPEKPWIFKTLPIVDGFLNVTVEDEHVKSLISYYLTIEDRACCPHAVAHYKSLPYMAETFNYHDVKEVAQLHPYDLKNIQLNKHCHVA